MPWIIEGTMKYQGDADGEIIHHANAFKIFKEDGKYTWTQDAPFKEEFHGIGNVLSYITDALDKYFYPGEATKK